MLLFLESVARGGRATFDPLANGHPGCLRKDGISADPLSEIGGLPCCTRTATKKLQARYN